MTQIKKLKWGHAPEPPKCKALVIIKNKSQVTLFFLFFQSSQPDWCLDKNMASYVIASSVRCCHTVRYRSSVSNINNVTLTTLTIISVTSSY